MIRRRFRPLILLAVLIVSTVLAGTLRPSGPASADVGTYDGTPLRVVAQAETVVPAETGTVTPSATLSETLTLTDTPTPTDTATATPTPTDTPTSTSTPTSTPTHTPTITPTPTPRPVQLPLVLKLTRLLINGDFESGSFQPGWGDSGTLPRSVVSDGQQHGASYAALLGSPDFNGVGGCPVGEAAIYQVIDVPAIGRPSLRFWYRILSYDTLEFDYFAAQILDWPTWTPRWLWKNGRILWNENLWSSGWRELVIPLDTYRGQTVVIKLYNAMTNADGWYNTWTYVDDIVLEVRP